MSLLISAIERASYAPGGKHAEGPGGAIADAAVAVRAALLASADGPRRLLALLVPRSLIVRPRRGYPAPGANARAG